MNTKADAPTPEDQRLRKLMQEILRRQSRVNVLRPSNNPLTDLLVSRPPLTPRWRKSRVWPAYVCR